MRWNLVVKIHIGYVDHKTGIIAALLLTKTGYLSILLSRRKLAAIIQSYNAEKLKSKFNALKALFTIMTVDLIAIMVIIKTTTKKVKVKQQLVAVH